MTHPHALRILIAKDAVPGIGIYDGALARWLCVNADNAVAQQRWRAMQRAAS
jgi:hypothetical protein